MLCVSSCVYDGFFYCMYKFENLKKYAHTIIMFTSLVGCKLAIGSFCVDVDYVVKEIYLNSETLPYTFCLTSRREMKEKPSKRSKETFNKFFLF